MKPVVCFSNVSKVYRIGYRPRGLREALTSSVARLFGRAGSEEGRRLRALDDVSFALGKGRALGIVGPNGAGKTTILKLLSRITSPTSGSVIAHGKVAALIELGAGFHPDLTGRENLFLNAAILGMSQREARHRFDEIVGFAELDRFIDTPVKRYSSGMYVRLAFAVAAHVEPEILLVDEVLVVGDARFQQKCIRRIDQLRRAGATILFVSHNMTILRAVCDEGIFILDGKVAASGGIVDVIRAYEEHFHGAERRHVAALNETHSGTEPVETDIQILSVSRADQGNEPVDFQNAFELEVRVESRHRVERPQLLARIIRSDGLTCSEYRTSQTGKALPDLEGTGSFRLRFDPLQLASGLYLVEIRIQDAKDIISLAVGQSDWFKVRGPLGSVRTQFSGVFVPHAELICDVPPGDAR